MAGFGQYIFSVTTAAIIYSVLPSLLEKKSGAAVLVRLIGGLFLTLTVIAPVSDIDFNAILDTQLEFTSLGTEIAADGQRLAQEQLHKIITDQSEAYILNKAMSYQTPLDVEVTFSQDETPVLSEVQLKGSISPYVKSMMTKWLKEEMGIPEEHQIWIE